MKRRGWVKTSWRITENNRRARYYELTAAGSRQLDVERGAWERASAAVNDIMIAQVAWAGGEA
jgi:PadR family transcriptional regulator PadR